MIRVATICVIFTLSLFICVLIAMGQAEEALVGYWPLDENSGKEVKDASGNGNDGTFVGDPEWVQGKFGSALEFVGSSSYVEIPDADSLAVQTDITFAAWFKPSVTINSGNGDYRLMSKNNDIFLLFNYEQIGHLGFLIKDPGGTNYVVHSTTSEWEADQWYHVAGTFDGNELKVYIDGELEASFPYTGEAGTSGLALWIGADDLPAYFPGAVDEVRLYNVALGDRDIKEMMAGPTAVHPSGSLCGTWGRIKNLD
jgi:hypothetical protein